MKKIYLVLVLTFSVLYGGVSATQKEKEIQIFGITVDDTSNDAIDLYSKGLKLYNTSLEDEKRILNNGRKMQVKNIKNIMKALPYFLSAGNRGHVDASLLGIDILFSYYNRKDKMKRINELSNILHKKGHLYGTYLLANDYKRGFSVIPDYKLSKLYYEIIVQECNSDRVMHRDKLNKVKTNLYNVVYNVAVENVKTLDTYQPKNKKHYSVGRLKIANKIKDVMRAKNQKYLMQSLVPGK